ncbi:MAG: hypothetical protein GY862_06720 [Gammaproteobacteria bacterium]|nr:hypothetical protein [Gammaproteobacteria bacterium]
MFDGENAVTPWDMNSFSVSSLPAFQRDVVLSSFHTVKLFEGTFDGAGRLELYWTLDKLVQTSGTVRRARERARARFFWFPG